MDQVNVKLLVNHYEREFKVQTEAFAPATRIRSVKEKLLQAEAFKGTRRARAECNIRVIYRGLLLADDRALRSLPGFSADELILTVFITKPSAAPAPPAARRFRARAERSQVWKWSTSAWIAIIATLWCYKFRFNQSFKNFSVLILYIATFFCLHALFSMILRGTRGAQRAAAAPAS